MATIRDVARRAGVSAATVSHVLNDTRAVLPETRRVVLQAVLELNYRPSGVARGLTTHSTRTVGVVIADVTSPFFAFLLRRVEDLLAAADYNLLVCNTFEQPAREAHALELLLDKRVDGVLLTPTGQPQPIYEEFNARHIPLVFIDRRPPDVVGSFVITDNEQAAYEVTDYLIGLGHRRIGLITLTPETSAVAARTAGYARALREASLSLAPELVATTDHDRETTCRAVKRLLALPEPPTALIAGSHPATLGALKALGELGLCWPNDISIICFDNSHWTDIIRPALTVVTKPIDALATSAVEILLESLAHIEKARKLYQPAEPLPVAEIQLEPAFLVRDSCASPALTLRLDGVKGGR